MLPEFIIGSGESDTNQEFMVRLHRPRFVARIQDASDPVVGDWCWIARGIERLVLVEWIDRPGPGDDKLLRRAAVFAEMQTMDAMELMG